MPNIFENALTIFASLSERQPQIGEVDALQQFVAGILERGFGDLLPIPEKPTKQERKRWRKMLLGIYPEIKKLTLNGSSDFLLEYWRVNLWGCDDIMADGQRMVLSDDRLFYSFKTGWAPPWEWVWAIAERFPRWRIELRYVSWDSGYSGWMKWDEGWTRDCEEFCTVCESAARECNCDGQVVANVPEAPVAEFMTPAMNVEEAAI
jgi:hypothetical protein